MSKRNLAISMLGLAVLVGPMWGTTCTSSSNPCTAGSASGPDTADQAVFEGDTLNTAADLAFTNISFASITAGNYSTAGLMADGVTFTGLDSNGKTADLYVADIPSWGSNVLEQSNGGGTITATISGGDVYAFGVDLIDLAGTPETFSISVNGGTVMTSASESGDVPASVFFGYTSATPITSVTITPLLNGDQLAIDNFEVGLDAQSPTPEVGTLFLIGAGLIGMRFMHRRSVRRTKGGVKPLVNCHRRLRPDGETRNRTDDIDRDDISMRNRFTGKHDLAEQAMLGFDALELIEDQVAERVENDAGAAALPSLDHVGMVPGDDLGAGVDGGAGELDLAGVGARGVLGAGVHGDDGGVGAGEDGMNVGLHAGDVHHGNTIIGVLVIAVRLVEGVGEEAEAESVAGDDGSGMRGLGGFAGADGGDAVSGEQIERIFDPVAVAVTRVIICSGDDVDAGGLEGGDHFGPGFEDHAIFNRTAAVRKRRFEIDEGDIGRGERGREIP